jgi:hypothetical protein
MYLVNYNNEETMTSRVLTLVPAVAGLAKTAFARGKDMFENFNNFAADWREKRAETRAEENRQIKEIQERYARQFPFLSPVSAYRIKVSQRLANRTEEEVILIIPHAGKTHKIIIQPSKKGLARNDDEARSARNGTYKFNSNRLRN